MMKKGALEIKCPLSHRSSKVKDVIDSELKGKDKSSFLLTTTRDVNKIHPYWHHIQGEIGATGVSWAHFVIWTIMLIIEVDRDHFWESTFVPILKSFYLTVMNLSNFV